MKTYTLICKECGKSFTTHNKNKKCCSPSCSAKNLWKSDEYRSKTTAAQSESQNRPDVKEANSKRASIRNARPEIKTAFINAMNELRSDPVRNQQRNDARTKTIQSETCRARASEIQTLRMKNPENIKNVRESLQKYYSVQENRDKSSMIHKQIFIDRPELRDIARNNAIEQIESGKKSKYKYKEFVMPSGRHVKLQGYEDRAIILLLNTYDESDILVGSKDISEMIGRIYYSENNIKRCYLPDLYIKSTNTIIEVKSNYTFACDKEKNLAKEQACLQQGFNFEFMIFER